MMTPSQDIKKLQENLAYSFQSISLLEKALIHPSSKLSRSPSEFERLEFLGDRVLGVVIAEALYRHFPKEKEGDLAKRLAILVSRDVCIEIAQNLDLVRYIRVSGKDIHRHTTILADALEAIIGAIYLDGGIEAAKTVIQRHFKNHLLQEHYVVTDSKTALQEWAQQRGFGIPVYTTLATEGPPHAPIFSIEAKAGNFTETASGNSKRQAEQQAAKKILEKVLQ